MVVKVMRWRPWPPLISRKYDARITVRNLEGFDWVRDGPEIDNGGLAVEIRWKGPKSSLGSFRRTVKRNCTREENVKKEQNGSVSVEWDEEFRSVINLSGYKETAFGPWEINFSVLHGSNQSVKTKISVIGSAVLNLSEYASKIEDQTIDVKIPLTVSGSVVEHRPLLCISLYLSELKSPQEPSDLTRSPTLPAPSPSFSVETSSTDKEDISAIKAGLRKVKIFTEYVSTRRAKKACREEGCSTKSDEGEETYPFDSDSHEESEGVDSEENKEGFPLRKSFSYGTLAHVNYAGVSNYFGAGSYNDGEALIYYSNRRRSDVGSARFEEIDSNTVGEKPLVLKRSILPWRKRKLSFRSPKSKGEPLLKKAYGEEGGDDIDFDRRQLSSDESLSFGWRKTDDDTPSSISEFGDDTFTIGTWEQKEIASRDGQMKIQTQVFFASIDQRSERAAGESACTALVAVLADWLHNNQNLMPVKSQFDSLIRDGSLEWRNLCENETYMKKFPDKHFDLETVMQAKIRDLCVVPEKSFIGFFHPGEIDENKFDFLDGAMSFDSIWDEIRLPEGSGSGVFIVSWNDHFFVLKVEGEAYYIIDTLGERLHEGCKQAYILKFDKDTAIKKLPSGGQPLEGKPTSEDSKVEEEEVVCEGKESCKEYIKSFLAAIPIRELQEDIKKGLVMSTNHFQRLQIELHLTNLQQQESSSYNVMSMAFDN